MTAAAKLRELLATRPRIPTLDELIRWWFTGGDLAFLVVELHDDHKAIADSLRLDLERECRLRQERARGADEEREVQALGDRIGFGRVMQLAEQIWDRTYPGSAHSTGPCTAFLVKCPCPPSGRDANGHCEWCCGAGRVTERVRRAMERT